MKYDEYTNLNVDLTFFKGSRQNQEKDKSKKSKKSVKELLNICDLPSFSRVCINLIILEDDRLWGSNTRSGYILGSVTTSIFEINY